MHFIKNLNFSTVEKIKVIQYSKNERINTSLVGENALLVNNSDNPS